MKSLGGLLGLIIAFAFIYWMRPLKPAAVMLVTLICVGFGIALGHVVRRKNDKEQS